MKKRKEEKSSVHDESNGALIPFFFKNLFIYLHLILVMKQKSHTYCDDETHYYRFHDALFRLRWLPLLEKKFHL